MNILSARGPLTPNRHLFGCAMAVLVIAVLPFVVPNDFYLRIAFTMGVNYLVAAGLNVLVGYTGQKSLGHAGLFAVGAYSIALLTTVLGLNPWLAFPLSLVLSAAFGAVIALPALRVSGTSLAMVTIAFGIVVEKIVTEWNDVFHGQQGIYGIPALHLNGAQFGVREWVWFAGGLCLLVHLLLRQLLRGKVGRAFRAVETGEIAAECVGISVYRFKVLAFVISAVTAGAAGALVAMQNQYINSDFITFQLSIFFLLLVLFGGAGNMYGPLIGAVVLTVLDAWLARWPHVQHFVQGALFLFTLFFLPKGLAALFQSRSQSASALNQKEESEWQPRHSIDTSNPVLLGTKLFKAYGGVIPVRDVDIEVARGEIHALIGPNGAGKTTLLNMLSGVVRPDRGHVLFAGQRIEGQPPHRIAVIGMGRTFQNLRLFTDMTVRENVLVGLHKSMRVPLPACLFGLSSARKEEAEALIEADALLHFVGLAPFADAPAGSLPYGSQRRLEIARALATHPVLLLIDEPAAGLNPAETDDLAILIRRVRSKGITVLLIEHHMSLVMGISDRVTVLDYGQKIAEGRPQEVQQNPRVIEAYLGVDDDSEVPLAKSAC